MIIYCTVNTITNMRYIGKDKNNNPKYLGSGTAIKAAIKKYGRENFIKEIMEKCDSIEELIKREEYWLNYYNVESDPLFYNKTNKSFGNSGHTEETKQKISKAKKGKKHTEETKQKLSLVRTGVKHKTHVKGKEHGSFGINKSIIHCNNMSKSHIGLSSSFKGKKHSDKTKLILSNNKKKTNWKKIIQKDLKGNILAEYYTIKEAKIKTKTMGVANALTGLSKTAKGFIWEYKY